MAYIVKAANNSGKVRYAGVSGGPPVESKDDAHVFFDKTEAEIVARKIRRVVPMTCVVTVEKV